MKKIIFFFILFLFVAIATDVAAQCPMCKMAAESNLKNGGTMGRGLNNGILYMLAAPYVFVGVLVYLWKRNSKQVLEDDNINADLESFSNN
jgi:hypothetical protein